MTEEKKQEIIKSFYNCMIDKDGDCPGCPYDTKRIECGKKEMLRDVLDLIHRLQDESSELKEENEQWKALYHIGEERKYRKMFVEEWKKEYQKELDKQGEGVIAGSPDFDYVYQRYFDQKAEIEQLTEELDKEYALRLKNQFACEKKDLELKQLEFEKAELQKRVDELKIALKNVIENNEELIEECEQAVKDTAKEIYSYLNESGVMKVAPDTIKLFFKERYGVEVE